MGTACVLPFVPGMSRVRVPPVITITSLTPLPSGEKMARRGLRWAKKKEGWLILVTYICHGCHFIIRAEVHINEMKAT